MDREKQISLPDGNDKWDSVDFRHLSAFQRVYREKNYANAGQEIFTTRKSIVRMMQNLERCFDCSLFSEGLRGELVASPFAERLYNDLRFLNAARHRMKDHIAGIHENGRILHIGSSAAVFRTREFRNLFRMLQSLDGVRSCYSPIDPEDAGKALVSGHCDLYIGCWIGTGSRYLTEDIGGISFRLYRRKASGIPQSIANPNESYVVSLDGRIPHSGILPKSIENWRPLTDSQWLYWLDHPEECAGGSLVWGPDVQIDQDRWEIMEGHPSDSLQQPLHASFLRQHPYEFLPLLVSKIQNRTGG